MKSAKKWIFLSILTLVIFVSCESSKARDKKTKSSSKLITKVVTDTIGQKLFDQKCMLCHNHIGKVDSTMLAPPFFAVKRRYLRASMDKDDFIKNITYWVSNPVEENILMQGTKDQFEVMPYLAYEEADIIKIASYIYDNDIPKPDWFDAHEELHEKEGVGHGHGMGNGKGRRMGRGQNQNK